MDRFPDLVTRLLLGLLLTSSLRLTLAREYYWTIQVKAGKTECFFESMNAEQEAEIEYQVLDGGDMDISVTFTSPSGQQLISDVQRQDGVHTVTAKEKGDHMICLDNSFSTMTDKLVFLDIGIDRDGDEEWKEVSQGAIKDTGNQEEIDGMSKSLSRVKEHLQTIVDLQAHLRAREARHRYTADSNNERVYLWSMFECGVMVAVGGLQVFMLRRLFGTHSKTTA